MNGKFNELKLVTVHLNGVIYSFILRRTLKLAMLTVVKYHIG